MIIFEWSKPGSCIDVPNSEDAQRIDRQIGGLEGAVIEATVVLDMFESSQTTDRTRENLKKQFHLHGRIYQQVEAEFFPEGIAPLARSGPDLTAEYDKRKILVEAEVRRRLWADGLLPKSLLMRPPFIFAKAFIHNIDLFDKFLLDLSKDQSVPEGIKSIRAKFLDAFPDLRGVRNSIQHSEDRSKGSAHGKKIDLKKIDSSKVSIYGIALVQSNLDGNRFGATMADGHYGAIQISANAVEVMRDALVDIYALFDWTGPEQLFP